MTGNSLRPAQHDTDVLGKRLGAVVIDGFVGVLLYFVAGAVFFSGGVSPFVALFVLPLGIMAGYSLLLEGLWDGYTVGKKVLGIRVVKEDGSPIDLEDSVVRNVLRFVDGICLYLVGLYFASTSERNQRLGDQIASTVVVNDDQTRSSGSGYQQTSGNHQTRHGTLPPGSQDGQYTRYRQFEHHSSQQSGRVDSYGNQQSHQSGQSHDVTPSTQCRSTEAGPNDRRQGNNQRQNHRPSGYNANRQSINTNTNRRSTNQRADTGRAGQ